MKSIKPDNTGRAEAGGTSRTIIEGGVVGEHLAVQTHAGVLRGRGRRDGLLGPVGVRVAVVGLAADVFRDRFVTGGIGDRVLVSHAGRVIVARA